MDHSIGQPEIYASISSLKNGVSPGPDDVLFEMLKHGAAALLPHLERMFELILRGGAPPRVWHAAIIAPLYKKLNKLLPVNFRPVVLRSSVAKLFERILMGRVMRVMEWGWGAAEQ